ncbi:sodium- and chloride-dependent glycine transporter 1-like [Ornithodoros turicata]|uniref:sodium- and chloride-dependent glycine transporter 1-like n=1 Tax=Ornithodoros turicata TaxID=34597 RepID=UPI003139C153
MASLEPIVPIEPREKWDNKVEFVLSCIGLSVGLGNVWRFPYIAFNNGGGAFLVPYVVLMIVVGRPMYFLELVLGQFCSFGSIRAFGGVLLGRGVGWSMVYVCVMVGLYYNVLLAYALVYIYYSLWKDLPWATCDPNWADDNCYVRSEGVVPCRLVNATLFSLYKPDNGTGNDTVPVGKADTQEIVLAPLAAYQHLLGNCTNATQSAPEQFFYKRVLALSEGLENLGSLRMEIACALVIAWILVFFCIFKGIRSSGKVVYVTAVAPFFIIGVLLIKGLSLEGAGEGLYYYFVPDWSKVLQFKVWQKAAEQIFFSLSVSEGIIICFGSYNDFRNDLYRDVYIIAFADMIVSIVGGVVVFSVLGNMAQNLGVAVPDVVSEGFGLAFIAYPQAISLLTYPNLWSAMFFIMLFFLAIDSQFALVESALIPFKDESKTLIQHEGLLAAVACTVLCLVGMPMACQGGLYITEILDSFVGGLLLPWNALFEVIFIVHVYGMHRLSLDIEFMLGEPPHMLLSICWKYICPAVLVVICTSTLLTFKGVTLHDYVYPTWANILGIFLGSVGVQLIIFMAIKHWYYSGYDCKKAAEVSPKWGPALPQDHNEYIEFMKLRCPSLALSAPEVVPPAKPADGKENPAFDAGEGHPPDQKPAPEPAPPAPPAK